MTITQLAHQIKQVTEWSSDNSAPTTSDFTNIMQAALNMPKVKSLQIDGDIGYEYKGIALWAPHRSNQLIDFRDRVMRHDTSNFDTTFNHVTSSLVFMIVPGQQDPSIDLDSLDKVHSANLEASRLEWWNQAHTRSQGNPVGISFGDTIPVWLWQNICSTVMAVSAASLRAVELGYHVQFLTLQTLSQQMFESFPLVCDSRPYLPMFAVNIGTSAKKYKISGRRNRTHDVITDSTSHFQYESAVTDDVNRSLGTPWSDRVQTGEQQRHLKGTYKPLP